MHERLVRQAAPSSVIRPAEPAECLKSTITTAQISVRTPNCQRVIAYVKLHIVVVTTFWCDSTQIELWNFMISVLGCQRTKLPSSVTNERRRQSKYG